MLGKQVTTSAALYFAGAQHSTVPLCWFELAQEFFDSCKLAVTFFSADGGGFVIDECQRFADRQSDLIGALRDNVSRSLNLDSPRSASGDRSDWRVSAFVWPDKLCYVGVDRDLIHEPSALLRRAYDLGRAVSAVQYGIAYTSLLADYPDCYAFGYRPRSFSEFRELLRSRREGGRRKTPDELWTDELNGQRRYLTGHFRGAYPANILSESHLRAADLRSHPIGKLSELDAALWLWELSDSEVPLATELLQTRGVLIAG
jgi:hypothetical protein